MQNPILLVQNRSVMVLKGYQLGRIEYETAFLLQEKLQAQRISVQIPDVLLILEHPLTLTLS